MSAIDPEQLMAYVDGELDEVTAARIARAVAEDPDLAARVAAERKLRTRLAAHYAPILEAPLPDRLTAAFGQDPAADRRVVDIGAARRRLRPWFAGGLAVAASLAIGFLVGHRLEPSPAVDGNALVADGRLAAALDMQLAATQSPDAVIRIGISFRARDGAYCRSFRAPVIEGIACRTGSDWRLRRTIDAPAMPAAGGYRQAGSGDLMAAAQAMMAGDPMDAAAEQTARDSGWK